MIIFLFVPQRYCGIYFRGPTRRNVAGRERHQHNPASNAKKCDWVPFGWLAPPKFTRASEPRMLWSHYTHNSLRRPPGPVMTEITGFRQSGPVWWRYPEFP
jgi:hypothetical protein